MATARRAARYRVEVDDSYGALEVILRPISEEMIDAVGRRPRQYRAIGGYVYDVTDRPGTTGSQVCVGLAGRGHTLHATNESLPRVIRRHARILAAAIDRSRT